MTGNATAIEKVFAWEALDSRGTPTVGCSIRLKGGAEGVATVPSGASTGTHEALELRDGGPRYGGRGVASAVRNVEEVIGPKVAGFDASDQEGLDDLITDIDPGRFSNIGANAALAVSVAAGQASSAALSLPLYRHFGGEEKPLIPMPMVNILSGGAHAARAVDFQDFLVIPVGAESFKEAIEWASRARAGTAEVLREKGHAVSLAADEGGLGPTLDSNRSALEMLVNGIARSGLEPGEDVAIAIDVAATQFYESGTYRLESEERDLTAQELAAELVEWCKQFPVISLEDPCAEDDWDAWEEITKSLGIVQLLGDDLFVTDLSRVEQGIRRNVANAVLVKPNQAGTLTAARRVIERCRAAGYAPVVSARSGETEDSWLADIAVGWRAGQIKVGSTTRSERTAKWNRLLRIERELGADATFAGTQFIGGTGKAGRKA